MGHFHPHSVGHLSLTLTPGKCHLLKVPREEQMRGTHHNSLNKIKPQSSKVGNAGDSPRGKGEWTMQFYSSLAFPLLSALSFASLPSTRHQICCNHLNALFQGGLELSTNLTTWKRCYSPVGLDETGQLAPSTAQRSLVITPPIPPVLLLRAIATATRI